MGDDGNSLHKTTGAAAAAGLAVSAAAMLIASWTLLQVEVLPLGGIRTGWWPVCAGGLLLLASWVLPIEKQNGGRAAFHLRLSALLVFGLAPFWQGIPFSLRVVQQSMGLHRAVCMLAGVAAFAVHNMLMADAMAPAEAGWCRALQRVERACWRLTGVLFLETLATCQLLVLFIQGEFRLRGVPEALIQCFVGVGSVPKYTGWLFCVTCALSALSRLGQAVIGVHSRGDGVQDAAQESETGSDDNGKQDRDDCGPGLSGDGAGDGAGGTVG